MTKKYYGNCDDVYRTYKGNDLGFSYSKEKTTFKVWAPTASLVELKLYNTGTDFEDGAGVIGTEKMDFDCETGIWYITISGDMNKVYYTYLVTVDGVTCETQDVYSVATGLNGKRSMVIDLKSTDPDGFENDKHVFAEKSTDAVIWEVHVKDFSISNTSGVSAQNRGKYLAFTEENTTFASTGYKTCVDYLVELGINYVHLNPVFDFASVDESMQNQYNWGYDPDNYNVPEGSYSTDPYHGEVRINEFKQMVQALHKKGIGVVMDVVYNHVYNAGDSCFQKTVPDYYFRKIGDKFLNSSGCGNVTASDKEMFRKFMIDSVVYWATQYHIDGFRFDLMACHDIDTLNAIREALDKIDSRILIYGEPWCADAMENGIDGEDCCTKNNAFKLSDRIALFNDDMRSGLKGGSDDDTKGYIQGNSGKAHAVMAGLLGASSSVFGRWAKQPSQCVTYASAHDNLTLWDKILKSHWYNNYSTGKRIYYLQNKLCGALILTSQGIPFFLAGEEFARTKNGDHNSYRSPELTNAIDWSRVDTYREIRDYYKGLIEIRKEYAPLRDNTQKTVDSSYIIYHGGAIGFTLENDQSDRDNSWKFLSVIYNNSESEVKLYLDNHKYLPENWVVIADDKVAGLSKLSMSTRDVTVPPVSAKILVDEESYNRWLEHRNKQ